MNKSYPKNLNKRGKLPSSVVLESVRQKIKNIKNKRGEFKRKVHYGCYLLGSQAGLRISEAVKFDLKAKTSKGLYRIEKPKGKKERLVYIPKEVIRELKEQNWQPNQTNRWNFYHFLQKTKRGLGISEKVELSPHTLRRAFATYHAESGMPLTLLQKLLGHSSIRTTATYWRNIHGDGDVGDILVGKKWLLKLKKPPKPPSEITVPSANYLPEQLPESLEPPIIFQEPNIKPNLLPIKNECSEPESLTNQILPLIEQKNFTPNISSNRTEISEQPTREEILLSKIKHLEEKLSQVQAENKHLKALTRQDQRSLNCESLSKAPTLRSFDKGLERTEAKIIQTFSWKSGK